MQIDTSRKMGNLRGLGSNARRVEGIVVRDTAGQVETASVFCAAGVLLCCRGPASSSAKDNAGVGRQEITAGPS